MTEEIIIDGVDVAGCVRLQDDKISCDLGGECKGWDNCYYKQLKRLEQENKELKEENKTLNYQWHKQSEIGDEWYKIAEKYKTALEEIRKNLKKIFNVCDDDCGNASEIAKVVGLINEVLE